jgi:hypothetical protein
MPREELQKATTYAFGRRKLTAATVRQVTWWRDVTQRGAVKTTTYAIRRRKLTAAARRQVL